jgi:hypothetical protein
MGIEGHVGMLDLSFSGVALLPELFSETRKLLLPGGECSLGGAGPLAWWVREEYGALLAFLRPRERPAETILFETNFHSQKTRLKDMAY